jgi:tripartite-type tricarboxylate transporter receptor subunit TctC
LFEPVKSCEPVKINRRRLVQGGLACAAMSATARAFAQESYPNAPIRFVIPTSAGGGHDAMMRTIGARLTEAWGQTLVVESKPGASGAIAATFVAKAPADGYTLLLGYSSLLSNLILTPNAGYKLAELAPVSMLALTPIAIGVRSSLGVKTLAEFIALAKSQPGKLSYGSYGPGSGGHFVGELLNAEAGINTTHVPYKGEAPALQDLLGGQIDAVIASLGGVSRYPGRIVPLAVASPNRFAAYKEVPTFIETGLSAVNMPGWAGAYAPANTPKPILEKLTAELNRIVMLPEVSQKLLELGFEAVGWPPRKLADFMTEQNALIQKLVSDGRIKL